MQKSGGVRRLPSVVSKKNKKINVNSKKHIDKTFVKCYNSYGLNKLPAARWGYIYKQRKEVLMIER